MRTKSLTLHKKKLSQTSKDQTFFITMPKKNPALLHKLSNLLVFLAKLKKPIIPKMIIFLKKTRKLNKFKQYSYYNYVKEYEFSPSSTPLIEFRRNSRNGRISFKKLYSISRCLGTECYHGKKELFSVEMATEQFPCFEIGRELMAVDSSSNSWSEDDQTVDERAERFIQRFYEDMRRQRQDYSNLQLLQM